ncbi:MAG: DUF6240 domain-containing protein, partial [bacterium]
IYNNIINSDSSTSSVINSSGVIQNNSQGLFENDIDNIISGTITQAIDGMYIIEFNNISSDIDTDSYVGSGSSSDNNTSIIKVSQESISGSVGDEVAFNVVDSSTLKQVDISNIYDDSVDSTSATTEAQAQDVQAEDDPYTAISVSIKDIISSEKKYNAFLMENKQADLEKIKFIAEIKSTLSEISNSFTDEDLKNLLKSNLDAKNIDVYEFSDYVKTSTGVDIKNEDVPEEKTLLELREDKKKYIQMDLNMNGIDEEDAMRFEKILTQADLPITSKNVSDIKSLDKKISDIKEFEDSNIFAVMKSKATPQGSFKQNTNTSASATSNGSRSSSSSRNDSGDGISITIDDLYSTKHSGAMSSTSPLPNIPNLDAQIENILLQDEIEVTQENVDIAKEFIKNELEISTQSFNIYNKVKELINLLDDDSNININASDEIAKVSEVSKISALDDLIARNLNYNKSSDYDNTNGVNKSSNASFNILNNTQDLINYKNMIESVTEYDLQDLINQEVDINLYNIYNNYNNYNNLSSSSASVSDTAISEKLNLAKIQMKLTMENIYAISKSGISIDTMPLAEVIDTLEELEEDQIKSQLKTANTPITAKNIEVMKEVSNTLNNFYIKEANNNVFNSNIDLSKGVYSSFKNIIEDDEELSLETISKVNNARASKILDTLEAFQTQPIKKFGDGIGKLDEQFEEFLDEHGFEVNEANKKALKILTANDMEFTQESLIQTKIIDQKLEFVHNNLHPLTVAKMLKDEFDPMEKTIDEVIEYLGEAENVFGKTSRELIANQILELDKDNTLTQEERSSMISIYRVLNSIEKNDSGAIGNILQSEKNLTFKNLLEASKLHGNYKKNIGIDKKVDNSVGEREVSDGANNSKDLESLTKDYNNLLVKDFIKNGSPSLIKSSLENDLENSLEVLLEDNSTLNNNSEIESRFISDIRAIENTHQGVISALAKNGIKITINNINIMSEIINQNKKPSDAIGDFKESLSENNIDFGTSILDLGLGLDDDLAQVQDG